MNAWIVSDVHLGDRHCRSERFLEFLESLPNGTGLVLNGDVLDRRPRVWPDSHQRILDRLREESLRRRVVWVRGNHEGEDRLDDTAAIELRDDLSIGKRLFVTHGHQFSVVSRLHPLTFAPFRLLYHLRCMWRGESEHIADFAKSFPVLFRTMCESVAGRAAAYARAHGYEAVTCGHTHQAEDVRIDGVRYLNTGAWTEEEQHALIVSDDDMELRALAGRDAGP